MSAYSATKFALIGLTHQVACEVSEFGIRVVAINPGAVLTEALPPGAIEGFAKTINLPGFREPMHVSDIGKVVAFLASDDARFITATSLNVDGGALKVI